MWLINGRCASLWCSCWLGLNTRWWLNHLKNICQHVIFPNFFRVKIKTCILNHHLHLVNVFPFESLVGKINKNLREIKMNVLKLSAKTSEKFGLAPNGRVVPMGFFKASFQWPKTVSFREGSWRVFFLGTGALTYSWTIGMVNGTSQCVVNIHLNSTPNLMEEQIHGEKNSETTSFLHKIGSLPLIVGRGRVLNQHVHLWIYIYIYSMD